MPGVPGKEGSFEPPGLHGQSGPTTFVGGSAGRKMDGGRPSRSTMAFSEVGDHWPGHGKAFWPLWRRLFIDSKPWIKRQLDQRAGRTSQLSARSKKPILRSGPSTKGRWRKDRIWRLVSCLGCGECDRDRWPRKQPSELISSRRMAAEHRAEGS